MPRYDGTGPWGYGPMTGRGMGRCNPAYHQGYGFGWGRGMGRRFFGRGWGMGGGASMPFAAPAISLEERKRFLEEELKEIDAL
ncbi:MAG: DUF5320 domain-containing protein, partial [Sphaerochaeta sp.]|nr:DUF5320 domain-containing protein [Sphaerochaeta sp.]